MARLCKHLCVLVAGTAALLTSLSWMPSARAYEEQASVDLAVGYAALLDARRLPTHASSFEVGAGVGLGEAVVLRASLGYARLRDGERRGHAGRLRLEGLYLLDVVRVVPFVGGGASLLVASADGAGVHLHPGAHVLVGIDYLLSRRWTLGLDLRTGLLADADALRSVTEVGLRMSRMFELF